MIVMKFGGSSVGSPANIDKVIEIVKKSLLKDKTVVVCSAFSGITDMLIKCGTLAKNNDPLYLTILQDITTRHIEAFHSLIGESNNDELVELQEALKDIERICDGIQMLQEFSDRTQAKLISYGERLSCFIVAAAFRSKGTKAVYVNASNLIKTDANSLAAKVNFEKTNLLIKDFINALQAVPIVTGFISSDKNDNITTLGRGGSDYTAAIIGAAIDASIIEIWTDVNGVLTADPRRVEQAYTIPNLTYKEAMELSHFGAKVIYPPTIIPALVKNIPLAIKNTFNPENEGSLITQKATPSNNPIKGISSISNITILRLEGSGMVGVVGTAARLFTTLSRANVNIIFLTQGSSEQSICFGVMPIDTESAIRAVNSDFASEIEANFINPLVVEKEQTVIAVVGENMMNVPGVSAQVFKALGKNGINVKAIAQGSSELNITVVIDRLNEAKALNALHEIFFENDYHSLNAFIVGPTGLIGSTLLNQIKKQTEFLSKQQNIQLHITGLINSRKMLIESNGIDLDNWEGELKEKGEEAELKKFVENMINLNFANSVFIDCSASKIVTDYYEKILKKSISVITPNKIANTLKTEKYKTLRAIAKRSNARFMYETNVGAGLPVINTLTNLLHSGDKILKIEAVLSGTLSFIFNNYLGETKFSDVVLEAKAKGFTEPDPRDDLSGLDVARKALILSREIGLEMELEDIKVQNLVPSSHQELPLDEFLSKLSDLDVEYEKHKKEAQLQEGVLRYMAVIEPNNVSIALQTVPKSHPFSNLSGSDNMIVFTTERYKTNPLVIKGPGAGAEVTAAGVFAELISIGNYMAN